MAKRRRGILEVILYCVHVYSASVHKESEVVCKIIGNTKRKEQIVEEIEVKGKTDWQTRRPWKIAVNSVPIRSNNREFQLSTA